MFFTKRKPRVATPEEIADDNTRFEAQTKIYRDYAESVRTKAQDEREATSIEREVMRNLHDWMKGKARMIAKHKAGEVYEYVFEPSKETNADVRQSPAE